MNGAPRIGTAFVLWMALFIGVRSHAQDGSPFPSALESGSQTEAESASGMGMADEPADPESESAADAEAEGTRARVAGIALPDRDPFWPVGYTRPDPVSIEDVPVPEEDVEKEREMDLRDRILQKADWPLLSVRAITSGKGRHVAMIDGVGIVQAGDIAVKRRAGLMYRWHIAEITATRVAYRRLDVAPVDQKDVRIPVPADEGMQ